MATSIRLARGGSKKRPYYKIVVADSRSPRDGRFIDRLGTFDPLKKADDATRLVLDASRVEGCVPRIARAPPSCSFMCMNLTPQTASQSAVAWRIAWTTFLYACSSGKAPRTTT